VTSDPLLECSGLSEDDLSAVLGLVAGTDVVELELAVGGSRVMLRRPPHTATAAPPVAAEPARSAADNTPLAIASPLVGIFHPAVTTGDTVSQGQVIGAIEALGMPTSVDAPQAGTVEQLLVPDGSAVEYGQPLLLLRRAPPDAAA
jgi:acetyl-CoA carboxylase biotin carboxyl carrier protein